MCVCMRPCLLKPRARDAQHAASALDYGLSDEFVTCPLPREAKFQTHQRICKRQKLRDRDASRIADDPSKLGSREIVPGERQYYFTKESEG